MPMNIGITGFLLIIVIALLFFGPSKLPQLGRAIGSTLREFRAGTREMIRDVEDGHEKQHKKDSDLQQ